MAEKVQLPEGYDPYDINVKRLLNPKADDKNFIADGLLRCGAKRHHTGTPCMQYAGHCTDHVGYGRCKNHGGRNTGPITPEGKAIASQNSVLHGLYAKALRPREAAIFLDLAKEEDPTGLKWEIIALKAKIIGYLGKWSEKWDIYYAKRINATADWVKCTKCGKEFQVNTFDDPYLDSVRSCPTCRTYNDFVVLNQVPLPCTAEIAEAYADRMTRITASETENGGVRTFYHAGDLDDRALDRALNTLKRLVETHNRLNQESGDDLVGKINEELRAASRGRVNITWDTGAQQRKDGVQNGKNDTK
jgi:hypothetical protein